MHSRIWALTACTTLVILGFSAVNRFTRAQQNENTSRTDAEAAARGRYLVHHVAMCIYCHTPRNEQGVLDERRLLHGAPMPIKSPFAGQTWAFRTPKIAGLPGGSSEEEMVRFLRTGETPTGHKPRPPMPPFRFNEQDARAVTAYLKSLQ